MKGFGSAVALLLTMVVSACSAPAPSRSPHPTESPEIAAVETQDPSPVASAESCWVTTAGGDMPTTFVTPRRALTAFAALWQPRITDETTDENTRVLAQAFVDTSDRARFTSRTDTEAVAEAPHRGDVATYWLRKYPEGWALDRFSIPLPMTSCGDR